MVLLFFSSAASTQSTGKLIPHPIAATLVPYILGFISESCPPFEFCLT